MTTNNTTSDTTAFEKHQWAIRKHNSRQNGSMMKVEESIEYLTMLQQMDEEGSGPSQQQNYLVVSKVLKMLQSVRKNLDKDFVKTHALLAAVAPRDLKFGVQREAEQKELVRRLDSLPHKEASEVHALNVILSLAKMQNDNELRAEIFSLLENEPVSYITSYCRLKESGKVQMVPAS